MLKRYWFYIVLLSTLVLQAQAQTTYPIQVNANLLPPYSAYLSDYYSGTREKLTLTLINRDQFKPTLNVRLRMIITAPGGLRLQTNFAFRLWRPIPGRYCHYLPARARGLPVRNHRC